jgi:DNA-binding XRE family transcriptional regulator
MRTFQREAPDPAEIIRAASKPESTLPPAPGQTTGDHLKAHSTRMLRGPVGMPLFPARKMPLTWDANLMSMCAGGATPMPVTMTEKQKQASRARAREWRQFRVEHLFSQAQLADALKCSRRTVLAVERGELVKGPRYDLLRKFRDLKAREERKAAEAAA